jgi:hypothetical protein
MTVNISITLFQNSGHPEDTDTKPLHSSQLPYMVSHPAANKLGTKTVQN